MKKLLKERFNEAADQFACNGAFIEKDYHALKILRELAEKDKEHRFIFSGGTSLSKGYHIIQRFSEDLDFKICGASLNRKQMKEIRDEFRSYLTPVQGLQLIKKETHDGGRKETIYLYYDSIYPPSSALRSELKIELFFEPYAIDFEMKNIASYSYPINGEKDARVPCNLPINTMADKFVALSCRLAKDPFEDRVTRHLYDLFELNRFLSIENNTLKNDFIHKVINIFNIKDKKQHKDFDTFEKFLSNAIDRLNNDVKLEDDYNIFTDSMSFMPDDKRISYKDTVTCYCVLAGFFKIIR